MDDAQSAAIRRGLADGDHAAIAALYDRCAVGLHRCLRLWLGSAAAADEALQDVFVAVARRADAVAGATDLDAYLARMARNRARDELRRRRRRRETAFTDAAAPVPAEADVAAVAAALAILPDEQREVVV